MNYTASFLFNKHHKMKTRQISVYRAENARVCSKSQNHQILLIKTLFCCLNSTLTMSLHHSATNWMMRIVMMSWLLSNPNTLEPNTAASRIMVCIPVEYQKNPLKNLRKAGSALNSFNTTNSSFQDDQNSFDSK